MRKMLHLRVVSGTGGRSRKDDTQFSTLHQRARISNASRVPVSTRPGYPGILAIPRLEPGRPVDDRRGSWSKRFLRGRKNVENMPRSEDRIAANPLLQIQRIGIAAKAVA